MLQALIAYLEAIRRPVLSDRERAYLDEAKDPADRDARQRLVDQGVFRKHYC